MHIKIRTYMWLPYPAIMLQLHSAKRNVYYRVTKIRFSVKAVYKLSYILMVHSIVKQFVNI